MAVYAGPNITINTNLNNNDLILNLSAANKRSYTGSGITWNNSIENGITGSLINGPSFSTINAGTLVFDGIDDYADIGSSSLLNLTGSITIDAWFQLTSRGTNYTRVAGKGDATNRTYGLWYFPTGSNHFLYQRLGTSNINVFYYNTIDIGVWYNLVATSNDTTHSLYLNGTLVNTGYNASATFYTSTASFSVGFSVPDYDPTFHKYHPGYISEVKVYNRALSATEISQNYNAVKSRFDSFF